MEDCELLSEVGKVYCTYAYKSYERVKFYVSKCYSTLSSAFRNVDLTAQNSQLVVTASRKKCLQFVVAAPASFPAMQRRAKRLYIWKASLHCHYFKHKSQTRPALRKLLTFFVSAVDVWSRKHNFENKIKFSKQQPLFFSPVIIPLFSRCDFHALRALSEVCVLRKKSCRDVTLLRQWLGAALEVQPPCGFFHTSNRQTKADRGGQVRVQDSVNEFHSVTTAIHHLGLKATFHSNLNTTTIKIKYINQWINE